MILADCVEHVYPVDEGGPMQEEDLGVYFVRGDNIALIGQIEAELEAQVKKSGVLRG